MPEKIINSILNFLLQNIVFRRLIARFATNLKTNKLAMAAIKKMTGRHDPWLKNKDADEFLKIKKEYGLDFNTLVIGRPFLKMALIALENDSVVPAFISACKHLGLEPIVIDPMTDSFFEKLIAFDCQIFLCRPNHSTKLIREMFREKLAALADRHDFRIYPKPSELRLYEAKRELAYFLRINGIPHPKTHVFYKKQEALSFLNICTYPQVFKSHNGAGSSGVEILKSKFQAIAFISELFDRHYINKHISDYRDIDYGYAILQEYLQDMREFRVIKIGNSWFGHEKHKLNNQEFMSGSGVNKWTPPTTEILSFCNELASSFEFNTMCFDVFLTTDKKLLINELQTWFGSYNPAQMYINDVPGRYVFIDNEWVFEKGTFNDMESMALRLVSIIENEQKAS